MVWLRKKYDIIALVLLQTLLCFVAFNKIIIHNGKNLFSCWGDGLKNYFTFYTYITTKTKGSFFFYDRMNYPHGDYIFYTDNTPILSVPLKFIHQYLFNIAPYLFYIHNLYFIAGLVVASYVAYKVLNLFLETKWFAFLLAICLVWINPQMHRFEGHFNLSSAWIVVASLYIFIKIYQTTFERFSFNKYHLYLFLLTVYAAFTHLYFLVIIGMNLAGFGLFWLFKHYKTWRTTGISLMAAAFPYASAFLLSFGAIRFIDTYYSLRRAGAEGYDWDQWKNSFTSLIYHNEWNFFKFFITSNNYMGFESNLYLGSFALYTAFFLILLLIVGKLAPSDLKNWISQHPFLILVFGAGLFVFSSSIGEVTVFGGNQYKYYNFLNPLLYLRKFTERVNQFRCLGRFGWLFFWSFNIAAAYLLEKYYQAHKSFARTAFGGFLCLMLISDARDFIKHQNGMFTKNLLLRENIDPEFRKLFESVRPENYQAIISLPPYHAGSEDYRYTFDAEAEFFLKNLQLQIVTGLPHTSSTMSRTPVIHAQEYMTIFSQPRPSETLLQQFNDKKVLVLIRKNFQNYNSPIPGQEPAKTVFLNCMNFLQAHDLTSLGQVGDWELMEWDIKHAR